MRFRTALYGRTSNDDDKRLSIEIQQKDLREWSVRDTLVESVAGEFWDADVSGKIPLGERPRGGELLAAIHAGAINSVAILFIDRFGRTLLDGLKAAAELEQRGVKIVAVNDGWDARREDDPLFFQFKLMIAEAEWRKIKARTIAGRKRAAERDNAPCGGSLIFGYRMGPNGQYVVDPIEAAIIRHVFEMAADGKPHSAILAWLKSTGVPPGRRWQKRTAGAEMHVAAHHASAEWRYSRVGQILRCRAYIGERVYGGKVYSIPAIVDRELWDKAQAIICAQYKRWRAHDKVKGLLSGLLLCPRCNGRYHFMANNKNGRHAYCCEGRRKSKCDGPRLQVAGVDSAVWDTIWSFLENPEQIIRQAVASRDKAEESLSDLEREEEEVQAGLDAIETEVKAVWAEQAARDWPFAWVAPRLDALNARRNRLAAQQAELRGRRAAVQLDKASIEQVTAATAGVLAGLAFADQAKRAEIVRMVLAAGEVKGPGEVVLHFKWGGEERFGNLPTP